MQCAFQTDCLSPTLAAARAARLLERIKIETRWLLISPASRAFNIDKSRYQAERAKLIQNWPAIRHRRVGSDLLASFYDVAGDQAALLTHLIEIRRRRAGGRSQ